MMIRNLLSITFITLSVISLSQPNKIIIKNHLNSTVQKLKLKKGRYYTDLGHTSTKFSKRRKIFNNKSVDLDFFLKFDIVLTINDYFFGANEPSNYFFLKGDLSIVEYSDLIINESDSITQISFKGSRGQKVEFFNEYEVANYEMSEVLDSSFYKDKYRAKINESLLTTKGAGKIIDIRIYFDKEMNSKETILFFLPNARCLIYDLSSSYMRSKGEMSKFSLNSTILAGILENTIRLYKMNNELYKLRSANSVESKLQTKTSLDLKYE